MSLKKWKILAEHDVSPSKWFPVVKHKVELPDGHIVDDFYISTLADVVMCIVVNKDQKIVFVHQYKHGVQDFVLELPAGRIEDGSSPEEGIRRELREETGFIVGKLHNLGMLANSPTKASTRVYGFLTTEIIESKEQKLDRTEDIEIVPLSFAEVKEKIKNGEINGSDTVALLLRAQLLFPDVINW